MRACLDDTCGMNPGSPHAAMRKERVVSKYVMIEMIGIVHDDIYLARGGAISDK